MTAVKLITEMLRLRFGGAHLAIALFMLNAIALYYLYSYNSNQDHFWFSKKGAEVQQRQPRIDQAHIAVSQVEAHHNHDQSEVPQPNPITTVFITPKPKTTTLTKSATATVTSVSQKTVTLTQTQTQTVETSAKPTSSVPKESLKFCQVCGPHDVYCQQYGEHNLARSRVYEGSNSRFRRVLRKALSGKAIKIGVLGGSVTKGHGLTNHAHNWTAKLLNQLSKLLPMTQIELVNGAVPATGSDYYSMCFGEHIPEDVDIVIIELAVNDQRIESNAIAYEWLLRGLLDLPNRPAVLNIQVMALAFDTITFGGDLHSPIAEFYDTPVISLRDMVLPQIFKNVSLEEHYFHINQNNLVDFRHISVHGHTITADLLTAYTQRQLCAIEEERVRPNKFRSEDGKLPNPDELEDMPRLRLFDEYNRTKVIGKIKPSCQSVRTDKHPLVPIDSKGWKHWTYEGNTEKPYFMAEQVGDYAKFEVEVGVMGRVRITYLRSKTFGLGDVWCWINDDTLHGVKVTSWWEYDQLNLARVITIAENVPPGKHFLTCEILPETSDPDGGHQFRLIAVDAA